ncbi:MAG TPA: hypothetical protein VJC12_00410 [Candidatus Paceibacterota bacterium]
MANPQKKIKFFILSAISLVLILYVAFQSRNLIIGPQIKITNLRNGQTINSGLIEIKGSAKNIAYIYLNDNKIFIDNQGNFSEKFVAPEGYFIIKLSANDKFGKSQVKLIQLIGKRSGSTSTSPV